MSDVMFGKIVNINKKNYVVSLNEFSKKQHNKYNNLNIIEGLDKQERLVSLLSEISKIFNNNKNIICIKTTHGGYIPINISNEYNNIYVYDVNKYQLKYLNNNIEYFNVNNIKINKKFDDAYIDLPINKNVLLELNPKNLVVFYNKQKLEEKEEKKENEEKEDDKKIYTDIINYYLDYNPIIIVPSTFINFNFLNSKIYLLSKSDYIIIVPIKFINMFENHFKYYIKDKNLKIPVLDYDNLIHLTMIVKNAGDKFEEVLTKNLPIIDRWTILDTGSTDNTIDIINKVLVGKKKGELYQEPFIDFSTSRNRCLDLAGNYCKFKLMLDDTYIIEGDLRSFLEEIRGDQFADSYSLYITSDDVQYSSNRITKHTSNLKYIYKIHEVIQMENNVNVCIPIEKTCINDLKLDYMEKRTMDRKELDLKLLFEMVNEYPNDPRHLYYIGQTYNILKKYELAFEYFMKRVEHSVNGNIQEKLDACFEAARLSNFYLNKSWEECEKLYLRSYEMDNTRPESMYFIGIHYYMNNDKFKAYQYIKNAFEIGYPLHCQYSLKPTLSYHFVPKFLSELCYLFEDYETGEKCCELFLNKKILNNEYLDVIKSWYDIYRILNKYEIKNISINPKKHSKPILCFLADGGFNKKWNGHTILKEGVGGSETYIIELAKYIQKSGKYNVIVFCNCEIPLNENYIICDDVEYRFIIDFFNFIKNNIIEHCIISRYSEYVPFALKSHINNVYFVAHDLLPTGIVFPIDIKLKKIFCLSEWHSEHFKNIFPQLKDLITTFYYGVDTDLFEYKNNTKKLCKFIYSSFPHRGLLPLLKLWPKIIKKYPYASLYIHSDIHGEWVNENSKEHMIEVKNLLNELLKNINNNIYYMGWTSKEILAQSWQSADVWFYPCIFKETFCLTALEAAISKTLVVTNNLAALQNTVNDRGIVIPIDNDNLLTNEWCDTALTKLFDVLDNRNKREYYVNKNYEWAKNLSWKNRADELIKILENNILPIENNILPIENNILPIENKNNSLYNFVDDKLIYAGMYNWTNDIPKDSRNIFINILQYFNNINNKQQKEILEIGTYTGTSLINILEHIPNSKGSVIDSWKNYNETELSKNIEQNEIEKFFYKNLETKNLKNKVNIYNGESVVELLKLIKNKNKYDVIYVDGSHMCLDCYIDLILSWDLLNSNGLMIIDDYLYRKNDILQSPYEAVNTFLDKYKNKYKLLHKDYRIFLLKL